MTDAPVGLGVDFTVYTYVCDLAIYPRQNKSSSAKGEASGGFSALKKCNSHFLFKITFKMDNFSNYSKK